MSYNYFQQLNPSITNAMAAQTQQVAYYRDNFTYMCHHNEYLRMVLKHKDAKINHLQNSKQCIPNSGISRCLADANFFETKLLYKLIDVLKAHNIDYKDEFEEIEQLIHEQKERVNILQAELLKLKLDMPCEKKVVEEVYTTYSKCNSDFLDIFEKIQRKKIETEPEPKPDEVVIEQENIFEEKKQNKTEFDIENGNFDLQTFNESHIDENVIEINCEGKKNLEKLKIYDSIKSLVYAKSCEIEIFLPTSEAVFLMQCSHKLDFHNIFNFLDKYGLSLTRKPVTLPSDRDVNLTRNIHVAFKTYHGVDTYEFSSLLITATLINSNNFELIFLLNYLAVNEILIERLEIDDKQLTLNHDLLTIKKLIKRHNPDLELSEKKLVWLRDEACSLNESIKTTRYDIFEAVILIFLEDHNYVEKHNLGSLIQKVKSVLNTLKSSNKSDFF